jgi:hypothetical protein
MTTDTTQNLACWQQLAREIQHVPGPVMLRPLLSTSSATAYRRAWRQMHDVFQREKVTNVVWAWTPETGDSQLQKFPGTAYIHWIVSPLLADSTAPSYSSLRAQLSPNLEMHQIPVLLLAPAPKHQPKQTAHHLALEYPEIRAVVFTAPDTLSKSRQITTSFHPMPVAIRSTWQQPVLVR